MTAEWRKLLALPTPRWTLAATAGAVVIATFVAAIAGPGSADEMLPAELGVGLPTSVAAIVLGAWMIGLEYGQRTIRRTLTADPRRLRLVLAKLAVVLAATAAVTIVLFAITAPLFSAIGAAHDVSMPADETLEYGLAALFSNLVYATVSFALALATRSMAGGMALALAFAFIIDTGLSSIPTAGDYTLSAAVLILMGEISGDVLTAARDRDQDVGRALVVTFAWMTVLVGASVARFTRTDVD